MAIGAVSSELRARFGEDVVLADVPALSYPHLSDDDLPETDFLDRSTRATRWAEMGRDEAAAVEAG